MARFSRWTLSELVATSYDKFRAGQKPNPETLKNLEKLSKVLNELYEKVGPFTFESVYRSDELNAAIGGSPNSLHRVGMAADLRPQMGAKAYAATLAKYPSLREKLGEIIVNSDNVVHVSLPTGKNYPIQRRTLAGYEPFTKEELKAFIDKHAIKIATGTGALFLIIGAALLVGKK